MPPRPGPRRRAATPVYGSPLPLPLVSTIGTNNLTATTVNVIGSVNPEGLAGNAWFAWGTTPRFGHVTTSEALLANSLPQAFATTLSGLTTGVTYYFAMVGQTAAGTVTSPPMTFIPTVAASTTNAVNVPASSITSTVPVPHYRFPIKFDVNLGVGVVEQDTLDEVFSNVQAIFACQTGACPELPTFGVPDPTFSLMPVDARPLLRAVQQFEPRANETVVAQAAGDGDLGTWQATLTTRYAASGQ